MIIGEINSVESRFSMRTKIKAKQDIAGTNIKSVK